MILKEIKVFVNQFAWFVSEDTYCSFEHELLRMIQT